jgi:hypothetical protein
MSAGTRIASALIRSSSGARKQFCALGQPHNKQRLSFRELVPVRYASCPMSCMSNVDSRCSEEPSCRLQEDSRLRIVHIVQRYQHLQAEPLF